MNGNRNYNNGNRGAVPSIPSYGGNGTTTSTGFTTPGNIQAAAVAAGFSQAIAQCLPSCTSVPCPRTTYTLVEQPQTVITRYLQANTEYVPQPEQVAFKVQRLPGSVIVNEACPQAPCAPPPVAPPPPCVAPVAPCGPGPCGPGPIAPAYGGYAYYDM